MGYKRSSSTAQCTYMAFDMCRFDILFTKIETKLPAVVTRVLIFVYERQYAWVRWGPSKSFEFGIKNGTRQGSVLSQAMFTVYIQELLDTLQGLGTGCNIGATFMGAVAWADNVLLTASTRGSMQSLLDACSVFAAKVGLTSARIRTQPRARAKLSFWLAGGPICKSRRHRCCAARPCHMWPTPNTFGISCLRTGP